MTKKPMKFIVTHAKSATANGTVPVYVETEDGVKVAAIWGKGEDRYDRAYLFAASPELLKAAKGYLSLIMSDYEHFDGKMGSMQQAYDETKAAIDFAEGAR